MSDLFQSPSDFEEFIFRITHNGGATSDCITVLFCDGDSLMLWGDGGSTNWYEGGDVVGAMQESVENGSEVDLQFGNLSEENQHAVMYRLNEAFGDYLELCEAAFAQGGDDERIAKSRATSKDNEGGHDSYGQGLYIGTDGKLHINHDGDYGNEEDDPGPFDTVREALLHSLPTDYSLSGPEYHSPYAAGSINAAPEATAALEALKAKVRGDDESQGDE